MKASWRRVLGIVVVLCWPVVTGCYVLRPTAQATPISTGARYASDVREDRRQQTRMNAGQGTTPTDAELERRAIYVVR